MTNTSVLATAALKTTAVPHTAPHGIMAHHLHSSSLPPTAQGSLSSDEFAHMLDMCADRLVPAKEWLDRYARGDLGDAMCLTFDDALRGQYDVALPELEARGLTAIYFIYTGMFENGNDGTDEASVLETHRYFRNVNYPDVDSFYTDFHAIVSGSSHADRVAQAISEGFDASRYLAQYKIYSDSDRLFRFVRDEVLGPSDYKHVVDAMIQQAGLNLAEISEQVFLSEDHINDLSKGGHVVGLHSSTHPTRMGHFQAKQQFDEYTRNVAQVKRLTGERPKTMSHPSNSYGHDTLGVLKKLGIEIGFRADRRQGVTVPHYELPRQNHSDLLEGFA